MAKVSVTLFKGKKLSGGAYPILIMLRDRAKIKYFSIGLSATEKQWDKENNLFVKDKRINPDEVLEVIDEQTGKIIKHKITYEVKNSKINAKLLDAQKILDNFTNQKKDWTFEQFKNEFEYKNKRQSFISYLDSHIEYLNANKRYKSAKLFGELKSKLMRFDSKIESKEITDIDRKYLQGFIDWCRLQGNKDNSISIALRSIRTLLNDAIKNNVGSRDTYPFNNTQRGINGIKISEYRSETKKRFIPGEYLSKIKHTTFEDYKLEESKHLFLFSFFCYGISWQDMALLTNKSNLEQRVTKEGSLVYVISYKRGKTKKDYTIQISQDLQNEIDWFKKNSLLHKDYILPIIQSDEEGAKLQEHIDGKRKRYNKRLKAIAKELDFPEALQDLTSYYSRHSFAQTLRSKGKGIDIIQQGLGHSSSNTTKTYLASFDNEFMAEQTENLID